MDTVLPRSRLSSLPAALAGLGTLLLWSGTPIANKVAVAYFGGLMTGVVRSVLAGAVALVLALSLRLPIPRAPRDRALLVFAGVSSFAAWPVTLSIGIERTTAGHAALILATIPIIAVLIAAVVEGRAPRRGWWLGAVVALGGCALLLAARGQLFATTQRGATLGGDLLVFAGGIICAAGYVAGGRLAARLGTAATTFWGLTVAMLVLAPVALFARPVSDWSEVPAPGWWAMAWMSLLSSLIAYVLWFFALGRGGIGRISTLLLVMPALTLIGAAVVLAESVTWLLAASCVAIVFGTYFAQRHAR